MKKSEAENKENLCSNCNESMDYIFENAKNILLPLLIIVILLVAFLVSAAVLEINIQFFLYGLVVFGIIQYLERKLRIALRKKKMKCNNCGLEK